jgi:hypothetical protein
VGSPHVDIVPAREAHAVELAPRMRAADLAEVRASNGCGPLEALLEALHHSEIARTALFDGRVACMWGVEHVRWSIFSGRVGAAWLLTSDLVEKHPRTFWRGCKEELPKLLRSYDMLINAIDARHAMALRWARHLSFELNEEEAYGLEGRPFIWFRVKQEDAQWA